MVWLFIDTRNRDDARIAWIPKEGKIVARNAPGRGAAALRAVEKDWDNHAASLKGIIVVSGPGSFSSIRTGVLYANLFSRFLGLPMYEMRGEHEIDLETIRRLAVSGELQKKSYIEPVYDREPNITVPRS